MFGARVTRRRYLLLALLGILLPTAFLAFLSIRLQREMFRFQNHILEETARFTADHAVSQVQDRILAKEREIHMHYRMVAMLQRFACTLIGTAMTLICALVALLLSDALAPGRVPPMLAFWGSVLAGGLLILGLALLDRGGTRHPRLTYAPGRQAG